MGKDQHPMDRQTQAAPRKGPFGLEMGLRKEQYPGSLQEVQPGLYQTSEVPKPHSALEFHVLQFGPSSGLAWIKAIGKTIETNELGTSLESAFDEMKKKLLKTYGSSENISYLMEGSIWSEPRDWMQGLLNGERMLAARWEAHSHKQLPDQLSTVFLVAQATDTSSGYIAIEYAFKNHEIAEEEIAALEDDAL